MSITEQILERLSSDGTHSTITASALVAAMLLLPSDIDTTIFVPQSKPYYKAIEVSDSSIQACQITLCNDTKQRIYHPKTALGKRLLFLREKAIAKGLVLLNRDEIIEEVIRRRGEVA